MPNTEEDPTVIPRRERLKALEALEALEAQAGKRVSRQHTLTQAVSSRWAAAAGHPHQGKVGVFRVAPPHYRSRPQPPKAIGFVKDLVPYASASLEDLWGQTETKLPAALDAYDRDQPAGNTDHEAVIKDALALHSVRSVHARPFTEQAWETFYPLFRNRNVDAHKSLLTEMFRQRHHGLWPAGREALGMVIDESVTSTRTAKEQGALLRDSLERLFHKARQLLAGKCLRLYRPTEGEFLISDAPAFALTTDGEPGPAHEVGLATAVQVVMPLTPTLLAATGPSEAVTHLGQTEVDAWNAIQIRMAQQQVYYRLGSGLESFLLPALEARALTRRQATDRRGAATAG